MNQASSPTRISINRAACLAKAGEYEWALQVLAAIQNQNDPRVLNYTGYSNRKAGRLEIGITYYRKALAIDPNFVLAREYLGEGYVAAGRIDLAKLELNEIKNRAGTGSEEYQDLSKAIATGVIATLTDQAFWGHQPCAIVACPRILPRANIDTLSIQS